MKHPGREESFRGTVPHRGYRDRFRPLLAALGALLALGCGFPVPPSFAAGVASGPFTLSLQRETGFFAAAGAFGIAGGVAVSRVSAPDPEGLRRSCVPGIDRIALRYHSRDAGNWSNVTVGAVTALPVLAAAAGLRPGDRESYATALIDLVMFAESSLLNQGLTQAAKGIVHRSRPWAYDSALPVSTRGERGAALSFWSGHTSTAFNAAVFAGYVYQKQRPGSRLVIPLWAAGLSAATITGALRVRAGQHFPTDVLAGAAAGSLTGWLVPRLHLNPEGRVRMLSTAGSAPGIGFAFPF